MRLIAALRLTRAPLLLVAAAAVGPACVGGARPPLAGGPGGSGGQRGLASPPGQAARPAAGRATGAAGREGREWRPALRAHAGSRVAALPAIAPDGRLLVAGLDGCVSSYSRTGRFLWAFWAEGPVVGALSVARDGTAYVTTAGGHVQALRADGTELWRRTIATRALGAALLAGGRLVVAGADGALYSIAGGALLWRRRVAERLVTRPVVVGHDRVVVGDAGGTLHSLAGAERREERLGGRFRQDPVVGAGGAIAVVLDDDLVVVDGELRERFTLRGVRYAGPAGEGWVAALHEGSLVQLDAHGVERARVPLAAAASASPVGFAGGALVPLESGELALVSASAGGPRRAARVGGAPLLSPVVTEGGASVVAASASGDVAVLRLE